MYLGNSQIAQLHVILQDDQLLMTQKGRTQNRMGRKGLIPRRVPPRGTPRVPAPLPLSPFSPPDRTMTKMVSSVQFSSVSQSCLTLCDPMDCNPPGSSVHGILQARTLEWVAISAAVKSLQLCPTLCDPIDGSPPGSPIPGILQARTLEWVAAWTEPRACRPGLRVQCSCLENPRDRGAWWAAIYGVTQSRTQLT